MGKPKKGKGSGDRNTNRPNGKAWKKHPKKPKAKGDRINGRSPANHEKREAWKKYKASLPEGSEVVHWKDYKVNAA
jgi:hypothetical protein